MPNAIEIESLTKTYGRNSSKVTAVDGLTLSIPEGHVVGFLGRNGAGKTTTIKMVCGLVAPTSGRVLLRGRDVARGRRQAMRQVGAVLEGTRNVYWRLSPWQNLRYFAGLKGRWGAEQKAHSEGTLRDLALWDRRHDPVRRFSRGMQQKVAIACALVADPPIVLLDEPTLGLDVESARTIRSWIPRLARERGKTVLITTHQLDMAQEACDRITVMSEGRLVADCTAPELLGLFRRDDFEVAVRGPLGPLADRFDGLSVVEAGGNSVILVPGESPMGVHGVLDAVRQAGLGLVSVTPANQDLENAFITLTRKDESEDGVGGAGYL